MSLLNDIKNASTGLVSSIVTPIGSGISYATRQLVSGTRYTATEFAKVTAFHFIPVNDILANRPISNNNADVSNLSIAIFSIVAAPLAWLGALTNSILVESADTHDQTHPYLNYWLYSGAEYNSNWVLSTRPNIEKTWWQRHLLGAPGHALGLVTAVAYNAIYRSVQIMAHSLSSFKHSSYFLSNLALPNTNSLDTGSYYQNNNIHFFKRYIMSLPGTILGSVAGSLSFTVIAAIRLTYNNINSFLNLSGSLLNLGFESNISGTNTVGYDNRSSLIKASGIVGYLAASLIISPLALSIYTIRKIPTVLGTSVSFLSTPITALVKSFQYFNGTSSTIPENSDKVMSKFKRIEQSLTAWGRLPEGETIDGHHHASSTAGIVKSITLNIDTPTERILHALISAYKAQYPIDYKNMEQNHPEFFNSEHFNRVVQEAKAYYQGDYFASSQDIQISTSNIDKVAELVKNHMQSEETDIQVSPHFYNRPFEPSFYALFQGRAEIANERRDFQEANSTPTMN